MESFGIKAVIFDMDGVLTDSEPLINAAAVAMFREKGLSVQPDDFLPFVGTGEDRYISGVAERHGFALDIAAAKKRTYELYLDLVPTRLEAFPGVVDLVRSCRTAGLKVAVASSADQIKIEANLGKIGLPISDWDAVISAEDVLRKKPAPDIFLAAAKKLGVAPVECAVIEDAVNGVAAAKAAGMRCIAVAHTFQAEQLAPADLIREQIAGVTLDDLRGTAITPPAAPGNAADPTTPAEAPVLPPSSSRTENPTGNTALPPSSAAQPVLVAGPPPLPSVPPLIHVPAEAEGPQAPVSPPRKPWSFLETIGLGFAIAAAFVFAKFLVGLGFGFLAGVSKGPGTAFDPQSGMVWALATLLGAPVMAGLSWLFASLRPGFNAREYLALKPVPGRQLLGWCLVLVLLIAAMDGVTYILDRPIVPDVMVHAYRTAGFLPLLWLALVVFAPVGEEIFFRGFLFKGFMHSIGPLGSIFLVSLIFAVIHLQYDLYGIALIFCTGLVFGLARVRTGSIYPTILMHAFMNLIATIEVVLKIHWQK